MVHFNSVGYLCVLFLFSFQPSFSQNEKSYYFIDYHVTEVEDFKNQSIKILGASGIDPLGLGEIDYDLLSRKVNGLFPDAESEGILCIDLENSIYQDLRNNAKHTFEVYRSTELFIGLLDFIKSIRPGIQIGVYAIPFPYYYPHQKIRNSECKLDEILKRVDIIFPSLYIYYPAVQKGFQANFDFLEENLQTASYFAKKYNKEVIPFVWYLIHPSNQRYGHELLDRSEFGAYLEHIWSYSDSSFEVKGILIWNSSTPFENRSVRTNLLEVDHSFNHPTDALFYYETIF